MDGDNEENTKKQVVVHLSLQEYKVGGVMKPGVSLTFSAGRQLQSFLCSAGLSIASTLLVPIYIYRGEGRYCRSKCFT